MRESRCSGWGTEHLTQPRERRAGAPGHLERAPEVRRPWCELRSHSSTGSKWGLVIGSCAQGLKSRMDAAKPEGRFWLAAKVCEAGERRGAR